jgi:hypothetical protein
MLKLFQSIFGGGEETGRYPESLIEAAIELQELENARGHHLVMLMVSLAPAELPPREDFYTAAARYLT